MAAGAAAAMPHPSGALSMRLCGLFTVSWFGCLAAVLGAGVALGAETTKPEATAPAAPPTQVHLNETAERRVPRDEFIAQLAAEGVDADARKLQGAINQAMAGALAKAKDTKGITVETTGYFVHPESGGTWQGSQSMNLISHDAGALMALVTSLQDQGLVMKQLSARISRESARTVRDELADEAIRHLRLRAEHVAQTLDARVVRYSDLQVGSDAMPAQPGAADQLTLCREGGETAVIQASDGVVSLTVSATVEMTLRRP
jgi:predicted secreted protein